ncbi:MAG TPA: hypothetical protein VGS22_17775 [Thermoanaerobaculia bacterium]|nr:hypothetical protein [Thermoanaerobaculia bacterium]
MRNTAEFRLNVFINCPFDSDYKPLFEATVFAVSIAGFTPRCALEAGDAGTFRLEKILTILSECRYGIHDLSRTEPGAFGLPRFNMPFELGLDLACKKFSSGEQREKRLLILDRSRFRYQKFLSDVAGQDIRDHGKSRRRVIVCVRDWLVSESGRAEIPGGDYMYRRYLSFQRELPALCRKLRLHPEQLTFVDLSGTIFTWLEENEV